MVAGLGVFAVAVAATPLHLPPLGQPSRLVDDTGRTIAVLGAYNRQPVPLSDIPPYARDAIIATEDHTFWYNPGIDPISIARAAFVDVRHHALLQGGSTLTQQLAKNLFLTQQRTVSRKAAELFWTFSLASHLPKTRILDLYFNSVYFGEGAYGIQAASLAFFGIPARDLDLAQCALLAGLVDAPSAYDPYFYPALARSRRSWVAHRMLALHMITPAQAAQIDAAPLRLAHTTPPAAMDNAPYVTEYALAELAAKSPSVAARLTQGGYVVHTTADLPIQYAARTAYNAQMLPVAYTAAGVPEPEAAVAALDPRTGGIRALIGGRDFAQTQFDRATSAVRQPGSTFKAALYSALLLSGLYTPSSVIWDHPVSYPGAGGQTYTPSNAEHTFLGPILMRRALAISDNVAAVRFAAAVGLPNVIAQARRMGYVGPLANNLTTVLGSNPTNPLNMARIYASVANGGVRVTPYMVDRVTDPQGLVVFRQGPVLARAYDPRAAAILTDILKSVISPYGTGPNLVRFINFPAVGKTGTSNNMHDGWFVGFMPTLAAAVWVGDDSGNLNNPAQGNATAGPIWAQFMQGVHALGPTGTFARPPGLVSRRICTIDGLLANTTCPVETDLYAVGSEPTVRSPIVYTGPSALWVAHPGSWFFAYHPTVKAGRPLSGGRPVPSMFIGS